MESFTGEGRSGGPAAAEGRGGVHAAGGHRMAPGVEDAPMGLGPERSVQTGEIADALPRIDPHDQRHDRILRQNAARRGAINGSLVARRR
jgi:hypothetical protein